MKHDERVKFKFAKLTIASDDLVLVEDAPNMLLHLFIDERITFSFRQKWFSAFNMFLSQILYCKGQAAQRGGNKMCR